MVRVNKKSSIDVLKSKYVVPHFLFMLVCIKNPGSKQLTLGENWHGDIVVFKCAVVQDGWTDLQYHRGIFRNLPNAYAGTF